MPGRVVPAETTAMDKGHVPLVAPPHLHTSPGSLLLGVLLWEVLGDRASPGLREPSRPSPILARGG